jgi:hypothetical protein
MHRIRLIHWKAEEAEEKIAKLLTAGYEVEFGEISLKAMRDWRNNPPAAFVIDLSRLPMQGRDVAMTLRLNKATRLTPLVFVEGEPEKVERIKTQLPDAVFTDWSRIRSSLKAAINKPSASPVVPESNLAGYSGTPLPKKLGIKPNSIVALVGAPKDFAMTLGELPEGAKLKNQVKGAYDLIIWFVRMRVELYDRMKEMSDLTGAGGMWIAWPKKASGVASDINENVVRDTGLASGLVDYKVCAIDTIWSGLKFAQRRKK